MKKPFSLALLLLTLSPLAQADNLDITCRTLGDVGECQNVSICKERNEGRCVPNPGFFSPRDPQMTINVCGVYNSSAANCAAYQPNNCHWEATTQCVPLRR